MNRDELERKAEALRKKIKQAAGDLTNDPALRDEGVVDEAAGNTREGFGHGTQKVGEFVEDLGKNIKQ